MRSKKLILAIAILLALGVALVALAPTLLSGYARGRVEQELAARLNGSVTLGGLSLGWFSAQRIDGLVIDGGPEVGKIDGRAEVAEGLLALIRGSDITLTLQGSVATTFDGEGRIGLARLAQPSAGGAAGDGSQRGAGETPLGSRTLRLKLDGISLSARGPDGSAYALEKLEGGVTLAGSQLEVALDAIARTPDRTGASREGALSIDLVASLAFDAAGAIDRARTTGNAKIDASRLALPTAAGELAFSSLRTEVAKDAQGTVKVTSDIVARLGESTESTVKADIELTEAILPDGRLAIDPAKVRATVDARAVPTGALQPFAPELREGVRLDLAKDIGETVNLAVVKQLGERARVSLEAKQLSLSFDGSVAPDGSSIDGGTLEARAALRPELLAALGVRESSPLEFSLRGERLAWRKADDFSRAVAGGLTVEVVRGFECAAVFAPVRARAESLSISVEKDLASPIARTTLATKGRLGEAGDLALTASGELDLASRALVKGAVESSIRLDSAVLEHLTKGAVSARGAEAVLKLSVPELAYIPSAEYSGLDALVARVRAELSGAISVEGAGTAAAVNDLAIECATPRGSTPGTLALGAKVDGAAVRIEQRFARIPKAGFDLAALEPSGTISVAGLDPSFVSRVAPAAEPWVGLFGRGPMKLDLRNGFERGAIAAEFSLDAAAIDGSGAVRLAADRFSASNLVIECVLTKEGLASLPLPAGTEIEPGARVSLRAPTLALARSRDASGTGAWAPEGDIVARAIVESLRVRRAPGVAAPIGVSRLDANASYAFAESRATLAGTAAFEQSLGDAEFSLRWKKPADARLFLGAEGMVALSRLDLAKVEPVLGLEPGRLSSVLGGAGALRVEFAESPTPSAQVVLDFPSLDSDLALEARGAVGARTLALSGTLACELTADTLDRLAALEKSAGRRFLKPASVALRIDSASAPLDAAMKPDLPAAAFEASGTVSALSLETRDSKGALTTLATGPIALSIRSARLADEIACSAKSDDSASSTGAIDLDLKIRGALGADPIVDGTLRSSGIPSATVDAAAGTKGAIGRSLGETISLEVVATGLSKKAGVLSAVLDATNAKLTIAPVRIDGGFLRLVKEPSVATLALTPAVREQLLASLHPVFADVAASQGVRIVLESFAWPFDGNMRKFDAVFTLDLGEAKLVNRGEVSFLLAAVGAGRTDGVEVRFNQLRGTIEKGRLRYDAFKVDAGKTAQGAWKNSVIFAGDIDLGAKPIRANSITTVLPLTDIANWSGDARDFIARVEAVAPAVVKSLTAGVEWAGPLFDAAGKFAPPKAKVKLPDFGEILKQVGKDPSSIINTIDGIGDLFKKPKR